MLSVGSLQLVATVRAEVRFWEDGSARHQALTIFLLSVGSVLFSKADHDR